MIVKVSTLCCLDYACYLPLTHLRKKHRYFIQSACCKEATCIELSKGIVFLSTVFDNSLVFFACMLRHAFSGSYFPSAISYCFQKAWHSIAPLFLFNPATHNLFLKGYWHMPEDTSIIFHCFIIVGTSAFSNA